MKKEITCIVEPKSPFLHCLIHSILGYIGISPFNLSSISQHADLVNLKVNRISQASTKGCEYFPEIIQVLFLLCIHFKTDCLNAMRLFIFVKLCKNLKGLKAPFLSMERESQKAIINWRNAQSYSCRLTLFAITWVNAKVRKCWWNILRLTHLINTNPF